MARKEFHSFAQFDVLVDTHGYEGGSDSGAKTVIQIRNIGGTNWEIYPLKDGIRIDLEGDDEIDLIIQVLRWCANTLARLHRADVKKYAERLAVRNRQ